MKSKLLIALVASLAMIIATAVPSHADTLDDPRAAGRTAASILRCQLALYRVADHRHRRGSAFTALREYISSDDGSTYED